MGKIKSIVQEIDYGKIKVKLNDIMVEKGVSTYQLSSKANIRFQTIQNLRKNTSSRIDFEVLAKICCALDVKVSDIIEYVSLNKE